jgi:ribosomal protein S18 acetylase RimI-like enzyme
MSSTEISMLLPLLPAGYWARPVTLDDAEAAAVLTNACHIALTGKPTITGEEIRSDWQTPTMNLATNTLAVLAPDGALAGIAELWGSAPHVHNFVFAEVHPQHQGCGIGTVLAGWATARGHQLVPQAPADARVVLRQFKMNADEAAARLLRDQGYELTRHNLRMVIDFDGPPAEPALPAGLTIRPFVRGQEERDLLLAIREEFRDHWGNVESPFEQDYQEWLHFLDTNPTCDPLLFFVAMDGGEIAGTVLCQAKWAEDLDTGWIYALGVRRPWRRRGLAQALLQRCFVALYGRGKRRARLGVDAQSLTGATRLYEKVGMRLERQYDFYEKELRGGRELGTQAVT